MTDPLAFILAVLALLGTPGPTNTLLATSGAVVGLRRSLPLLTGELAAYLISVLTLGLLLRPMLESAPLVANGLKLAVVAYLCYAALKLWRRGSSAAATGEAVGWRAVFITTLLNPKGLIFALSILPFGRADILPYLGAFALSVVSVGLCWTAAGSAAGFAAGERNARHAPRIAALALAGFAGFILASVFG